MFEFPTAKQMKAVGERSAHSEKRGVFRAELEVEPKNFIPDYVNHSADGQTYVVQAIIDREDLLISFVINIPRDTEQGICYVNPNPLDKKTVYAVMLSVASDSVKLYIGGSGFVKFKYSSSERRIEGEFEYICLQGKTFKGDFDVYEI
jgi:hypothetical protein